MGVESMLVVVDFVIPPGFVLIDSYVGGKMNLDLGDVCLFHKLWALRYSIGRGNEDDGGQEGQRKMHSLDRSVIQ